MYEDLNTMSQLFNSAFSSFLFYYTTDCMFYYATHLLDVLIDPAGLAKIFMAMNTISGVLAVYLAADGCKKVEGLRRYVAYSSKTNQEGTIKMLLFLGGCPNQGF